MTKHTAVFTIRQGRVSPSGSSEKLLVLKLRLRRGCSSRYLAWIWWWRWLFNIIQCFLKTLKAGGKDTLSTWPQMHKHKYGSCAGAGQYVRHTAGSGQIHLDYTVCKHSIFQFPLLICENLIRRDLRTQRGSVEALLNIIQQSRLTSTQLFKPKMQVVCNQTLNLTPNSLQRDEISYVCTATGITSRFHTHSRSVFHETVHALPARMWGTRCTWGDRRVQSWCLCRSQHRFCKAGRWSPFHSTTRTAPVESERTPLVITDRSTMDGGTNTAETQRAR